MLKTRAKLILLRPLQLVNGMVNCTLPVLRLRLPLGRDMAMCQGRGVPGKPPVTDWAAAGMWLAGSREAISSPAPRLAALFRKERRETEAVDIVSGEGAEEATEAEAAEGLACGGMAEETASAASKSRGE